MVVQAGQAGQAGQAHTEDEASPEEQDDQHIPGSDAVSTSETSPDLSYLALTLIAELSACVQRVSSDLAQAGGSRDLELARQRWAQRLRALADMVELAEGEYAAAPPSDLPLSALPPYPRRNRATRPFLTAAQAQHAEQAQQAQEAAGTMPIAPPLPLVAYRWMPLTRREREVLKLTQRGYPPRRIASRLIVSVETVYTHLRNIRRKQREWEQEHQTRSAQ